MKLFFRLIPFCWLIACQTKDQVDLIVHNAVIYTVDSNFTIAEALCVKDGKIVATGSNQTILHQYAANEIMDGQGKPVYPGFIDAHAHFFSYALSLQQVDLTGTKSWAECLTKLKDFVAGNPPEDGQWIIGRGWDQNVWPNKRFPEKDSLDKLFPKHPVLLTRIDGHAAIANQVALSLAGIQAGDTQQGGIIGTSNGHLTGLLIDNAIGRVSQVIPEPNLAMLKAVCKPVETNCFAVGLTTVVDCGLSLKEVNQTDSLHKSGALRIRLVALLSDAPENYNYFLRAGKYKTDRLNVPGFKLFADGALGSRGACLLTPYHDKPGWQGFMLNDTLHFTQVLQQLYDANFQACTHAIGDSANRTILKLYAGLLKPGNDRRWRIEHAQIVDPADLHYFGQYRIIPSVQPTHATSDMYWAESRLGSDRIESAYPYKALLQQNGWMPLGTDFPVEDISPFKTLYAAVERKDANGYPKPGFNISNAITREQALRGMTIWAAKGSFEEKEKGSIEKGKLADFIVTDTDIMQCAPQNILQTTVLYTYLNGERVYEKNRR